MATTMVDISSNGKVTVIVRLTTSKDVSTIAIFACELADFEKLAHICEVTDAKLLELNI